MGIVWGGFVVRQATLTRFFALHFLIPLAGFVLILAHVYFLHHKGSSTPAGPNVVFVGFMYYFVTKDLVGVLALGVRVLLIPILRYLPGVGGMHKVKVFLLIRSFIVLTALGGYELGPYFLGLARVARVVYFGAMLTL